MICQVSSRSTGSTAEIVCGAAVYLGLAVALKLESLTYLWNAMKAYLGKNRKREEPTCGPDEII